LDVLLRQSVFTQIPNRKHRSFSNPRDPLHFKSHDDLVEWIHDHAKSYFD